MQFQLGRGTGDNSRLIWHVGEIRMPGDGTDVVGVCQLGLAAAVVIFSTIFIKIVLHYEKLIFI